MKRYANFAFIYAILAMLLGAFYREFTKFNHFTGKTTLSVLHTHYFVMGMFFCLILLLLEKSFSLHSQKLMKPFWVLYTIGLNLTAGMLLFRGIVQVTTPVPSRGLDLSISGLAGLGHVALLVALVLFFLSLKKQVSLEK